MQHAVPLFLLRDLTRSGSRRDGIVGRIVQNQPTPPHNLKSDSSRDHPKVAPQRGLSAPNPENVPVVLPEPNEKLLHRVLALGRLQSHAAANGLNPGANLDDQLLNGGSIPSIRDALS